MSVSEKSLQKIIKEEIKPIPKWEFLLRELFIWSVLIFFAILGGLSLSLATAVLQESDLDLYQKLNKSFLDYLFQNTPYALFFLAIIFIAILLINLRNTKTGYRHTTITLVMVTLGSTLVLCGLFTFSGFGNKADDTLEKAIQPYIQIKHNQDIWNHPEQGFLSGVVWKINNQKNFILLDPNNNLWVIDTRNIPMRSKIILQEGHEVKIIGRMIEDQFFEADEIRLWREVPLHGVVMVPVQ